jgi:cellulose biosynthesis protein BcsQ
VSVILSLVVIMGNLKLRRASDGSALALGEMIHKGGEGFIYSIEGDSAIVAKIYQQPTADRTNKLRAMLANPPVEPSRTPNHVSFCWPMDTVQDESGSVLGFIMPFVEPVRSAPLSRVYHPGARKKLARGITWEYLLRTATNLTSVVGALHERGYVVGDLNDTNILVSDTALVTLVDCDSMQVRGNSSATYRCMVGRPEYTPPELHHTVLATVERATYHDAFALAVLIFQLLMEGMHPFQSKWLGSGEPPELSEHIRLGDWMFAGSKGLSPPKYALPLNVLPPAIQWLMVESFVEGHRRPESRPSAEKWHAALLSASASLRTCSKNEQHRFSNHLTECPWCHRTAAGLPDPFPPLPKPTKASSNPAWAGTGRSNSTTPRSRPVHRRAHVLAIHSCKAQNGATTTAINLGAYLAEAGYKTLVIDLDPASNATTGLGVDPHHLGTSIYEVLVTNSATVVSAIKADILPGLSLLPAKVDFYAAEIELVYLEDREYRLKKAIDPIRNEYDYILIDCRSWLGGIFSVVALTAADGVLLPLKCTDYFALEGFQQLLNTIKLVRDRLNPTVVLFGVVLTMYDPHTRLSSEIVKEIQDHFPHEKFNTIIPYDVRLAETPSFGVTISQHAPRSFGALAYRHLADEVIARAEAEIAINA